MIARRVPGVVLALEPVDRMFRELAVDQLEGEVLAARAVDGPIHHAHGATAELLLQVTSDTVGYYPLYPLSTAWQESSATWNESESGFAWSGGAWSAADHGATPLGFGHTEDGNGLYALGFNRAGVQWLQDLVDGLNALGVGPRDMISILQSIKAAGALQAEIEVL